MPRNVEIFFPQLAHDLNDRLKKSRSEWGV